MHYLVILHFPVCYIKSLPFLTRIRPKLSSTRHICTTSIGYKIDGELGVRREEERDMCERERDLCDMCVTCVCDMCDM